MKKLYFIILLLISTLLWFCEMHGAQVTRSKAEQVALNWMLDKSGVAQGQLIVLQTIPLGGDSIPTCYALNLNPTGFVIVSADDAAFPVIGYSSEGRFDRDKAPPGLIELLDAAMLDITETKRMNSTPPSKTANAWSELMVPVEKYQRKRQSFSATSVGPLLQTRWGQGTFLGPTYNKFCPSDWRSILTALHTPTGCVATAMAQTMRFRNYPTSGIGSHEYTHSTYGNQSANFGGTNYDWNNMPTELSGTPIIGSTTAQIDAVAALMYHCGVAVDMDYGPLESGAFLPDARNALIQYFDYGIGAAIIERDRFFTTNQYLNMLKYQLDKGRPMIYVGYGTGGHCFVVDGYQGSDYFHFNWGWDGESDGYFYLNSLTPDHSNFTNGQAAIVDIQAIHTGQSLDTPVLFANEVSWDADKNGSTSDDVYVWNSNSNSASIFTFSLSVDAPWLTTSRSDGVSGQYLWDHATHREFWSNFHDSFTITAEANTTGSTRVGHVTITSTTSGVYASPKVITVSQPSTVSANAVDVALVIDKSPSMDWSNYFIPAKNAAKTFIGFMQNGDNIAVVSFCASSSVNVPLTTITSDATKVSAQNAVDAITVCSATSIGSGLQVGQSQLNSGRTQTQQAMILLSDGEENTAPMVATILPTIPNNTHIYTIALGPQSDENLLNYVASQKGGVYYFAPTPEQLQEIYNLIRGTITNQQSYASFNGTVTQGATQSHIAPVDALTSVAIFSLSFQSGNLDLDLVTPSGSSITPTSPSTDTTVTYNSGANYKFYQVKSPEPGEWTLHVTGTSAPTAIAYTASVQGTSSVSIHSFLDQASYSRNEPIQVSTILTASGGPITGAKVVATVNRPSSSMSTFSRFHAQSAEEELISSPQRNGLANPMSATDYLMVVDSLYLYDDGLHGDGAPNDGLYSNTYNNTVTAGSYTFTVFATGTTPQSGEFSRQQTFSTVITGSSVLATPNQQIVANNSTQVSVNPVLKWTSVPGALYYNIRVSYFFAGTHSTASLNVLDSLVSPDSVQLHGLLQGKTYSWRVRAVVSSSSMSEWSPDWKFTTEGDLSFRSMTNDSLALEKDQFGKIGKYIKRKADKIFFGFDLTSPAAVPAKIKFSMPATGVVVSGTDTITSFMGLKELTTPMIDSGVVIHVEGIGAKGSPIGAKYTWATVPTPTSGKVTSFTKRQLGLPMPNRINILYESFRQGGFANSGGLVVGIPRPDSSKAYGWLLSPKYTDVLKTLYYKGKIQDSTARALDVFSNHRPILGRQKALPPTKYSNILLGDLITLKANIVASALGILPNGFGELIFNDGTSHPLNGRLIRDIATTADSMMSAREYAASLPSQSDFERRYGYGKVDTIIKIINASFEGVLDTIKFADTLRLAGTHSLSERDYFSINPTVPPACILPSAGLLKQQPVTYMLLQNYPNPFNPTTTIEFSLPNPASVTLKVYNILGEEVATLFNHDPLDDGDHEIDFDASRLASGVYFYRLVAEPALGEDSETISNVFISVKKMLLIR